MLFARTNLIRDRISHKKQNKTNKKKIKETYAVYNADTQYTRQSLNEKQQTWLHRQ